MELSALAGNAHVKAVLSQQEGGRGLSHAYILSLSLIHIFLPSTAARPSGPSAGWASPLA